MFRFETHDEFLGLQTPISIEESIQPPILIGGFIVATSTMITDDLS